MHNTMSETCRNCRAALTFLSLATFSHFKVGEALQTSKLQGKAYLIKVNYSNELGEIV
jgi:hypothetical protein